MRKTILIALAFACLAVSAFADCTAYDSSDSAWCSTTCATTYTEVVCQQCTTNHANYNESACVSTDCSTLDSQTVTDAMCADCSGTLIYANNDGSACSATNCADTPTTFTDAYCTACEPTNTVANAAADACEAPATIDCTATPSSGSFTNAWCQQCASGVDAKSDSTACATASTGTTDTTTTDTTSGTVLSVISSILLLFITL